MEKKSYSSNYLLGVKGIICIARLIKPRNYISLISNELLNCHQQ